MLKKIKFLICAFCFSIISIIPALALSGKYDQIIFDYKKKYLFNANILITKSDEILYNTPYGFADIEHKIDFTNQDMMQIASLTKQFTATSILLLQEDGKLKIHEPIINYLKSNDKIWQGKVPDWANKVTIHYLLTHTSGIFNYTDLKWNNLDKLPESNIIPTIISGIKNKPLTFSPGQKFQYNNTGYLLLGEIVARVADEKDLGKFILNRIIRPLELEQTFLPPLSGELQLAKTGGFNARMPKKYETDIENLKVKLKPLNESHSLQNTSFAVLAGAGGMISSIHDLQKFYDALYNGKILRPESLKLMTTPYYEVDHPTNGKVGYGYGVYIHNIDGKILYSGSGWGPGVRTYNIYNPDNKIGVIILSNLSPYIMDNKEKTFSQSKSIPMLAKDLTLEASSNVK